jgi:hypothetical protein
MVAEKSFFLSFAKNNATGVSIMCVVLLSCGLPFFSEQ